MALIETQDLWKTYVMGSEEIHALRGVDLTVNRGEYVAIMGPSGSGKSTLMNMIGCLDSPDDGEYWLNGKLVSKKENPDKTVTFHWKQETPHVSYLITLVVGKFEVVQEEWNKLPVLYYVPKNRKEEVARTFGGQEVIDIE